MECNRDEATRANKIAGKKLEANDVSGAKRFALKAQSLYPDLKGLSQMLAVLDVLLSAENKIDGVADWYGILGVDPSADDATIKKQFKKLALMIHSDKNRSAGADRANEAFRLIKHARDLLSDNSKRIAYNQKRFPKTSQQPDPVPPAAAASFAYNQKRFPKTSQQPDHVPPAAAAAATAASGMGDSSTPPVAQGSTYTPSPLTWLFFQQLMDSNHHSTSQNSYASATAAAAAAGWGHKMPSEFLTNCSHCKMPYMPPLMHLNQLLRCSNCYQLFLAVRTV